MKTALIITGNMVQDHEFIYPYYRLKEAKYKIVVALEDKKECRGILGTKIPCDNNCEIISYEEMESYYPEFDLLVIPGGSKCMEKLRQEREVLEFIARWNEEGKVIASICSGAHLLISAKIVKGRLISGYVGMKDDIINAGAIYNSPIAIDDNIISCSHYKYLGLWMEEVLKWME